MSYESFLDLTMRQRVGMLDWMDQQKEIERKQADEAKQGY